MSSSYRDEYSQNFTTGPGNGVAMEVLCWIKPKIHSFFPVADAIDVHICLNKVRFTGSVAQELKIKFMVLWPI